jgi:YVTN family beta-propeller protein
MGVEKRTRLWGLGGLMLLAASVVGCGGNSTAIGVTVNGPVSSPMTVLVNGTVQFTAAVTGSSTTTVYWQVCLPATTTSTITPPPVVTKPTSCTPIPSVTPAKGTTILTGYGTITQTGLYTAPSTVPTPDNAVILATSTINANDFATFTIIIDSGIRVQVLPSTATIGPNETFQFTATVTGSTNTGVAWSVSSSAAAGTPIGTITSTGLYTAPNSSPGAITVTAQSSANPTQTATASVTVASGGPPAVTSLDPTTAAQGSVQQDVYVLGSNFLNTETVVVTAPGVGSTSTPVPTIFLSTGLLRATIPASQLQQMGILQVAVQMQNGDLNTPGPANLTLVPVRPAVVSSTPDSISQNNANANVQLTGGYFSPGTTIATFNGLGSTQGVTTTLSNSRQLALLIPGTGGNFNVPGLYPIVVQNTDVPAGQPFESALNLAVTPTPTLIPAAATGTATVGTVPSAVAVDYAQGIAVVVNSGSNSVSLINILTHAVIGSPIPVGNHPTGVAIDDLLPHPLALVVNNTDQTVTTIDLTTESVVGAPLSVSIATSSPGSPAPLPFAIGVNPLTHRALVAYQSTNEALVLDLANANPSYSPACAAPPCPVTTIGGSANFFGTGANPSVAVDPRLNWAVVTPGGAGSVDMVDLGFAATANDPLGRTPVVVGTLSISSTVQGVGINPETHTALFADPDSTNLTTFSLLDGTVTSVSLANNSGLVDQLGFVSAAATPLEDVGIAVNANSTALIVDLENANVLQTVTGVGVNSCSTPSSPCKAVAVDPVSNQAIVANQADVTNNVSFVSLGPSINPLQIIESSPAITYTSTSPLTLTVTGNFPSTAVVRLDQTALATTGVAGTCTVSAPVTCRQLSATVPASMLGMARRFIVDVAATSGSPVSNVTDLTVVQSVPVGNSPVGVAIDADRDMAVVTNSGDGTVSLVALTPDTPTGQFGVPAGSVGTIGSPISVGTTPEGVAVLPRLGLAIVANNGSNNASVVDETGVNVPETVAICATIGCTGPTGVAVDQDTGIAFITDTNAKSGNITTPGNLSFLDLAAASGVTDTATIDQNPVAVAIDPVFNPINPADGYAAVATASQTSSLEFVDTVSAATAGRVSSGIEDPSGIVFDPVNQVFLVANSLENEVVIVDPATFVDVAVRTGIDPTSLDYNFQTSTLVTANGGSHTMSVLDYLCPPTPNLPTCPAPQVRDVIGIGGTQNTSPVLGPNAVAIDLKLNLAVLVDQDNNRVLLVPLPH